jgi:uncharacterized protein (TIGR02271 family)
MDVYDVDNDKIGSIAEIYDAGSTGESPSGGGYLRIPTGFLGLGREHHIPFGAIRNIEGDRVYLSVPKDQLDQLGYHEAPAYADDTSPSAAPLPTSTTDVSRTTTAAAEPATGGQDTRRLQLRQEELVARKQQVQTGQVQIGKEVVSEQRTLEVPVTREEVYVERRPVERRVADRPIGDQNQVLEVPVREEQVTVEKQPVVYEEVELGKRAVQDTQQVSGTVRREEARIEQQGNVNVQGATSSTGNRLQSWDEAMPAYRTRWQQQAGSSGGRWEDAEASYRYGHELRSRPEYAGQQWGQIEPQVRSDWERQHPNTPWDRASQSIRDAWGDATDR